MKKSKLTRFRMEAGLTAAQVVAILKDEAPMIDKTVISKAEHPEMYGVELSPRLWGVLKKKHPDAHRRTESALRGRKADRHKQTGRLSVRLSEAQKTRLQLHLSGKGSTVQEFLEGCIEKALAEGGDVC